MRSMEQEMATQASDGMGKEPPVTMVGAGMGGDKVERVMELLREMDAQELRELQAEYVVLLSL